MTSTVLIVSWERQNVVVTLSASTLACETATFFQEKVWEAYAIPPACQRLKINGKFVTSSSQPILDFKPPLSAADCCTSQDADALKPSSFWSVNVLARLPGGKGGFGSLLRGQKGARRKTKNFDACRDLSGRRLRHSRAMERLTKWLDKKKEDEMIIETLGGDHQLSTNKPISATDLIQRTIGSHSTKVDRSPYYDQSEKTIERTTKALKKVMDTMDISILRSIKDPSTENTKTSSSKLGGGGIQHNSFNKRYIGDLNELYFLESNQDDVDESEKSDWEDVDDDQSESFIAAFTLENHQRVSRNPIKPIATQKKNSPLSINDLSLYSIKEVEEIDIDI